MEINLIVVIRLISALLFFLAFYLVLSSKTYSKEGKNRDVWLLISASLLLASLESLVNGLEWANIFSEMMDVFGEYLIILFFFDWIFIAFKIYSRD